MTDPWKKLFRRAVEQLREAAVDKSDWSFGGGTVLKLLFNHRESKDIDIFFRDRQLLSCVSPRLVDANENELIGYSETSSYIKLNFPEGQVDFIVAGQISDEEPQLQKIPGFDEEYYLDFPVEIVAKKIFYRYEDFTARDVFDLAFVFYKTSEKLVANADKFRGKIKPLIKRIEKLKTQGYLAAELNSLRRRRNQRGRISLLLSLPSMYGWNDNQ